MKKSIRIIDFVSAILRKFDFTLDFHYIYVK